MRGQGVSLSIRSAMVVAPASGRRRIGVSPGTLNFARGFINKIERNAVIFMCVPRNVSFSCTMFRVYFPTPGHFGKTTPVTTRSGVKDWLRQRKQVAKTVRTTVDIETSSETGGEPLSPSARLFHAPGFNCCIIAVMGCKTKVDVNAIKAGLKQTLLKHPRFSSKLIRNNKKPGRMKWVETTVDLEDHVIIPNLDSDMDKPDQFVEDYVSGLSQTNMDMSKPLWELHILTVKTSEAESVGIFRIHHSIGDGASLVSLLLACTRKTSDPNALPNVPRSERAPPDKHGGFRGLVINMLSIFCLVWNTFVDLLMFAATVVFLKDTETPIKGRAGVGSTTKRFIHRTVNLNDIKMVKRTMNMVNAC